MKKFLDGMARGVVRHKFIVLAVFVVITIASIVSVFFVDLNSDFFSYLPKNSDMKKGLDFLETTFNMSSTIMLGVDKVEQPEELQSYIDEIKTYEGVVADNVMWWGMFEAFKDIDVSKSLDEVQEQINSSSSIKVNVRKMMQDMGLGEDQLQDMVDYISTDEFKANLQPMFHPADNMYVIVIQLNVPCASDEAIAVLNNIDKMFAPTDYEIETGGMTDVMNAMFNTTLGEIWKYVIMAVPIMFIILFLTTDSLVDPFIFMITLGVSIVVNMGTNIIFNLTGTGVSAITYAASAVLQLGLAMDYTIFLMHACAEERQKTLSNAVAMERAIPRTFSTVAASALTTAGGFLAMFFMKFELGGDLGLVLAKGVVLALLTVVFLQPCLMLFTTKISDKTAHRIRLPSFKKTGSFSIRHRKTIVAIAILLLVPALIFGNGLDISYTKFVAPIENPTAVEATVGQLSNSVIVMAPVDKGSDATQRKFIDKMNELIESKQVTTVLSAYTMMPEEYHNVINVLATNSLVSSFMPMMPADMGLGMMTSYAADGYALYMVMLTGSAESPEAGAALKTIKAAVEDCFGNTGREVYVTGMEQAVSDLAAITPTDFMVVSIVSALLILIILIFTLRSFKLSVLVVAVIELGIFINLALVNLVGGSINFMCYIVLSAIQLGATVDYAILFTVKYKRYLDSMSAKEAAYKALSESGVSVITSVAIMAGCCLSVTFVSSNVVIGDLCMMIARGSLISGLLVLLLLPGLLVLCTGNRRARRPLKIKLPTHRKIDKVKVSDKVE